MSQTARITSTKSRFGLQEAVNDHLSTDVLVVGGGVAGMYTAINVDRLGLSVLLVVKGLLGKSGVSPQAGIFTFPPEYTPETFDQMVKDRIAGYAYFICDQELVRKSHELSPRALGDLEDLGLYFRRYDDGSLVIASMGGIQGGEMKQPWGTLATKWGNSGRNTCSVLRSEIVRRGVKFIENATITSVLVKDGEAKGIVALDYLNGKLLTITAKSVILATGPGASIWTYYSGSSENTGDGHAVALRAGAELSSMEMVQWHMACLAWPYSLRRQEAYPFPLPPSQQAPRFFIGRQERFMPDAEVGSKALQANAVAQAIIKGAVNRRGGYYASYQHFSTKDLKEFLGPFLMLKRLGYDLSKDTIECAMSIYSIYGGIRVNTECETKIKGLYAAGGAAGPIIPGLYMSLATGIIAAESAGNRARAIELPDLDLEQAEREKARVLNLLKVRTANESSYSPMQIKKILREVMWEKMDFIKTETGMKECLERLRAIRLEMLPKMRVRSDTTRFNVEWLDAVELLNMFDLAEVVIASSLMRKESRGPFRRADFPAIDDKNWLVFILARMQNSSITLDTAPIELKYAKPSDRFEWKH